MTSFKRHFAFIVGGWLAGAIYMAWLTFCTKEIGNFSIACKISILIIHILNIISCTRYFRVRIPM